MIPENPYLHPPVHEDAVDKALTLSIRTMALDVVVRHLMAAAEYAPYLGLDIEATGIAAAAIVNPQQPTDPAWRAIGAFLRASQIAYKGLVAPRPHADTDVHDYLEPLTLRPGSMAAGYAVMDMNSRLGADTQPGEVGDDHT